MRVKRGTELAGGTVQLRYVLPSHVFQFLLVLVEIFNDCVQMQAVARTHFLTRALQIESKLRAPQRHIGRDAGLRFSNDKVLGGSLSKVFPLDRAVQHRGRTRFGRHS